jgi:hypothetical protein
VERIFERCCKKFSERAEGNWDEVKVNQKAALKSEHEEKYGK